MISILDTKSCNLNSIHSAVYNLGYDVNIINISEKLNDVSVNDIHI